MSFPVPPSSVTTTSPMELSLRHVQCGTVDGTGGTLDSASAQGFQQGVQSASQSAPQSVSSSASSQVSQLLLDERGIPLWVSNVPVINLSSGELCNTIDRGIVALFDAGASDITIQSGDYIFAYINRRHIQASNRRVDDGDMARYLVHIYKSQAIMTSIGGGKPGDFEADLRPYLDEQREDYNPDFSLRMRCNATRSRVGDVVNGASLTMRTIPDKPRELSTLMLPRDILENIKPNQGLVLVCGITGSGKTTLLASVVRSILEGNDPRKIITFEDPIEFTYARLPSRSIPGAPGYGMMPEVSQVLMGQHMQAFDMVTPNILRRKSDVVILGEMRDKQSVESGLLVAQTGHATYGTLHCETPAEAMPRVIAEFPYDSQPAVANKLLDALRLVVAQKIEPNTQGKGQAFRSWCVFDRALKARLSEVPFSQWSGIVRRHVDERRESFEWQAMPFVERGELSFQGFLNVSGFNINEARKFLAEHSPASLQRFIDQGEMEFL